MIARMGKAEFAQLARDPRLAYANYVAKAENLVARIPNAAKKIRDANWSRDADPGMLLSMTAARSEYALDLLHISYSVIPPQKERV